MLLSHSLSLFAIACLSLFDDHPMARASAFVLPASSSAFFPSTTRSNNAFQSGNTKGSLQASPLFWAAEARSVLSPTATLLVDFLGHCLLWTASTLALRLAMPPLQRLLLPSSTQKHKKMSTFLEEHHHEQFDALSPLCWTVHVAGQALLSLTAARVLLPHGSAAVRALGGLTLLNAAGGGLLLGSHALIGRNAMLEKLLDLGGTRIVRAANCATGPAMLWPAHAVPAAAAVLALSAAGRVTFSNPVGRILSLAGVGAQLFAAPGLSAAYKTAVASLLLAIPFLPESQYDGGHTVVAATISLPYLVLLLCH